MIELQAGDTFYQVREMSGGALTMQEYRVVRVTAKFAFICNTSTPDMAFRSDRMRRRVNRTRDVAIDEFAAFLRESIAYSEKEIVRAKCQLETVLAMRQEVVSA